MNASAVLLAAGRGERMEACVHKAFLELAGQPLVWHAAEAFARVSRVRQIVLVVHEADRCPARAAAAGIRSTPVDIVVGGATRRDSSLAGVRAASAEIVLIHDACRPFVSSDLIERVLDAAETHGAAVPVLPSTETLYYLAADGRSAARVCDRGAVVRAQTPQGFRRASILQWLEDVAAAVTDDGSAALERGEPVLVVPGETSNRKITFPEDLVWAESWLHRSG